MTDAIEFESNATLVLMKQVKGAGPDGCKVLTPEEFDIVARRMGYERKTDESDGYALALAIRKTLDEQANGTESRVDTLNRIIRERDEAAGSLKEWKESAISRRERIEELSSQLASANASAVPEKWRKAIGEAVKHDRGARLAMSESIKVWRLADAASQLLSCLERLIEDEGEPK